MIENEDDFVALPLEVNGRSATITEKQAEYARLSGFKERDEYGKDYNANHLILMMKSGIIFMKD